MATYTCAACMRLSRVGVRPWHVASVVCVATVFWGLSGYPLLDPDESRYAEIPREMAERGDWITPTLNYVPYFEKPPLTYWLIGGSMRLLGENELAVRLVPAVCAALGLAVAFWLGSLTFGPAAGRWAPLLLATSPLYFVMARIPSTDIILSALLAGALTAWWAGERQRGAIGWMHLASGLLLGLAVLAKGPTAMVLFVGVVVVYVAWTRQFRGGLAGAAVALLVGAVVAAPWFIAVQMRNPQFAHFFFVVQHFERFTGNHFPEHHRPVYYYLPMLPAGFLWWSALWPAMARNGVSRWRELSPESRSAAAFLISWVVVVFLFFSAASSKLMPYVLPCWWPLAALTAGGVCKLLAPARVSPGVRTVVWGVGAALVVAIVGGAWYAGHQTDVPAAALRLPVMLLAAAWAVSAGGFFLAMRVPGPDLRLALLVTSAAVVLCGLIPTFTVFAAHRDVPPLIPACLKPPDPRARWTLAQYKSYNQGLNFYTQSRVVLIDSVGEIRLGLDEPDADQWFLKGEDNIDRLSARGPLALVVPDHLARQVASDHRLTIWAINRDRAMLFNEEGLRLAGAAPGPGGAP